MADDDIQIKPGDLPAAAAAAAAGRATGATTMTDTERYLLWLGIDGLLVFTGERLGGWWRLLSVAGSVGIFYNLLGLTDELEGSTLFQRNTSTGQ